jgi:hypothetical protein
MVHSREDKAWVNLTQRKREEQKGFSPVGRKFYHSRGFLVLDALMIIYHSERICGSVLDHPLLLSIEHIPGSWQGAAFNHVKLFPANICSSNIYLPEPVFLNGTCRH